MPPSKDNLSDLERHVQLLEANVAKLTQSLSHWQLLEAEYEALREEVAEVAKNAMTGAGNTDDSSSSTHVLQHQQNELVRIRRDFDGQLVDQKTVSEIFGARPGHTITKKPEQIWGVIDRRLDYVRQNAATLKKQVTEASNRLAAAQVVSRPDMLGDDEGEGESGGPITDIIEELDDDDNVVNVRLQTPSNTHPHVLEALKKAGIDELPEDKPNEEAEDTQTPAPAPESTPVPEPAPRPKETSVEPSKEKTPAPKPAKKGVSFADDTKDEHNHPPLSAQEPVSHTAKRLGEIMRTAKDQESTFSAAAAVSPVDESEDDAALRREMLEYSMSEIGPIVAQLDIEEATSDEDYDDEDEEEDDHGRSKYSVIDEAYRERMRELEKKLGVAPLKNGDASTLTGATSPSPSPAQPGGVGRIRVAGVDAAPLPSDAPAASIKDKSSSSSKTKKKSVSFASALDIAEPDATAPASISAPLATEKTAVPFVEPLSDVVVERSSENKTSIVAPAAAAAAQASTISKKKPSRFKAARAEGGAPQAAEPQLPKGPHEAPVRFLDQDRRVAPEGPEGKTVADTIVEREPTSEPREPDELDAALLMQETTAEYHRTRNRLIQRQGGFMRASEAAVVPLDEEEGGPKRVSKFKAARLSRQ